MKHLVLFENFTNEEIEPFSQESNLLASTAKRIYQFLKSKGFSVMMNYQNTGLASRAQSKKLGGDYGSDFRIDYYVSYLTVSGEQLDAVESDLKSQFETEDIQSERNSYGLTFRLSESERSFDSSQRRTGFAYRRPGSLDSEMYRIGNKNARKQGIGSFNTQYRSTFADKNPTTLYTER